MFEHLKPYPRIVVTGPQRSGTTIATHMIACDTGHKVVDEEEFGTYFVRRWREVLCGEGVVVQCPTMIRHVVETPDPAVLAVLVRRPLAEIHASRDRIDWWRHEGEMLRMLCAAHGDSAALAYALWDEHPPPNSIEIDYHALAAHPLWVPPERRADFTAKQVR